MLSINNKDDIPLMMQYHRTRDMLNLIKYFPEISPITDLTIVTSLEEYYDNLDYCNSFYARRNDTLITKPSMKSVEVKTFSADIAQMFKRVKELDSDGVLVFFNALNTPSERYDRYAGISIGVSVGNGVYIEAVGRGFDGREVSKGLSVHERYYIPWFELSRCNINNFREFRTYLISREDYQKSREERIKFLLEIGLPLEKIEENVPSIYQEIPDFIWLDVIVNVLKKLYDKEIEFRNDNLLEFAISGHTEGKRFRPWQIFDKRRYTL